MSYYDRLWSSTARRDDRLGAQRGENGRIIWRKVHDIPGVTDSRLCPATFV